MHFEKISENQIRCTLNISDLEERNMSINELTYCSEKATDLFQELLRTAAAELGFYYEDAPLMIEAIPLPTGSLMLLITKVEDPEELDTRFSRFTPDNSIDSNGESSEDIFSQLPERADEILELFRKAVKGDPASKDLSISHETIPSDRETSMPEQPQTQVNLIQFYRFASMDAISEAAGPVDAIYHGVNSLYKDPRTGSYYLAVNQSQHSPEEFNKVCNLLAEYGDRRQTQYATQAFLEEHCTCIIRDKAIQVLANL